MALYGGGEQMQCAVLDRCPFFIPPGFTALRGRRWHPRDFCTRAQRKLIILVPPSLPTSTPQNSPFQFFIGMVRHSEF